VEISVGNKIKISHSSLNVTVGAHIVVVNVTKPAKTL